MIALNCQVPITDRKHFDKQDQSEYLKYNGNTKSKNNQFEDILNEEINKLNTKLNY